MHDSVRKLALQIYKNTHRVASTPELVTKKYQVNKEDDDVDMSTYWHNIAKGYINRKLQYQENNKIAKNVILFVGDGMGVSTVTAARILRGQLNGRPGEETILKFEEFPHAAFSKTYTLDRQTPDSAGTATAIVTGIKANFRLLGLDGSAKFGDCEGSAGKQTESILDWAMDVGVGKSTGIISNARITHATPAASYAHVASRNWEGDVDMKDVTGGCRDIAQQLIRENQRIKVIMGGGRRYFLPNTTVDPETNEIDKNQRQDGLDLVQEWKDDKKDRGVVYKYAWNKDMFDEIDPRYTDYVLGLFAPSHMHYELDRDKSGPTGEPSLSEMTKKAIQILKKDKTRGFFLYVEAIYRLCWGKLVVVETPMEKQENGSFETMVIQRFTKPLT